ncbi:hypothetical protein OAU50_04190 [Planctomycetota bacterium]|nr:hypothetical protein [Planctomycetota bacterium]
MKYALLALLIFLLPLAAHPMDDKAEMQFEARVTATDRIELHFEFRYKDTFAVATELGARLDLDGDGQFSDAEIKQRFLAHTDEILLGLAIETGGKAVFAEARLSRCRMWDLENPTSPATLDTSTFGYDLVFSLTGNFSGPIKITFSGQQSVVHTPALQMLAFDFREPTPQKLECRYSEERAVFPWMTFEVPTRPLPIEPISDVTPEPEIREAPSTKITRDLNWIVLMFAGAFVLAGTIPCIQSVRKRRVQLIGYTALFWGIALALIWRELG